MYWQEAFFNYQMGVLIDLIGLKTSTDFKWLSIDLKLELLNFRISGNSQN